LHRRSRCTACRSTLTRGGTSWCFAHDVVAHDKSFVRLHRISQRLVIVGWLRSLRVAIFRSTHERLIVSNSSGELTNTPPKAPRRMQRSRDTRDCASRIVTPSRCRYDSRKASLARSRISMLRIGATGNVATICHVTMCRNLLRAHHVRTKRFRSRAGSPPSAPRMLGLPPSLRCRDRHLMKARTRPFIICRPRRLAHPLPAG
jgi:hypothetical protein